LVGGCFGNQPLTAQEKYEGKDGIKVVAYVVRGGDGRIETVQDFYIRCECDIHIMRL
jgi:hypothetical protein